MAASMMPNMAPIFLLLCFLIVTNDVECAKLNAPKVLLPYYSQVITNFTLQVEYSPEETQIANCYQWRSTRPEVAQVQLVNSTDGSCAQTALVSAMSKTSHQMTTVVLAENKVTGEILRTNVIVGEIVRLEIETTTRLLYLEDSPEELIVRGFDSEGNIFSNLEGLSFEWNLISDNETGHDVVDAHNILRIKRFSDSHYTTPAHIAPLEEKGLQGDKLLVEGVGTGSAKVSTRLRDPVYKNVKPYDVRIMVIANLMLSPQDAYVLPLARVKYTVEILKHNSLKEIKMPSKQYYLEVKDKNICRLEMQTSMVTAQVLGTTEIVLKDRNIVVTEFFRQPSAMIHVVSPGFLAFVVLPHRKWVLETGRVYEIIIEIYDTDSHKIYPSDNVRVVAEFPSTYFKVLHSSVNGTYHHVQALLKGETVIDRALFSVVDESGEEHAVKPEMKRSQDVEIFDPITVTPSQVFFPWDPVTRCVHRYTAQAYGGSGEYIWSLTNTSVASVNIRGLITTVGPGKCNVTAADVKNSAHFGVSTVQVLAPADIRFSPRRVEAAIGSQLEIPVSVFAKVGKNMHAFTDCRQLPLNIKFSEPSVFEYVVRDEDTPLELPETGCTSLTFLAKRQGHTEVYVTYQSKNVLLQASLRVAAYNPLMAIDPELEAVVALGSSKELIFHGGPQPWVLDSSKFFQELSPEKQELVKVNRPHLSINRGYHSFIVSCQDFGEQEIQLSVGNGVTAKNKFPVTDIASIRFQCSRPVELHLQPALNLNPNLPPCPVPHEMNLPMPVHYNKDLDLLVTVTDSSGRRFDNFSSLDLSWTVSQRHLAQLLHLSGELRTDIQVEPSGRKILSNYQTMRPQKEQGSVIVQASIDRYKSYVFAKQNKKQERITPVISKSLELFLVQEAELSPSTLSVFNHPSNQLTISILHGSGYFRVEEFESQVITAAYERKKHGIQVTPRKDGFHSFTVYDLCLEVTSHPLASVSVSGVGSVQVNVIEKMEVQKEVLAAVQVLDLHGKPLLASFFSLMGLKLEAGSDIVSLRPVSGGSDDGVTGVYTVYGAIVGHTTLTASVKLPTGQVIYSAPKPLEVFPPLRLDPKNITLIIGAKLQVLAFGGPQPQSNVEFSIQDSRISTVTGGGMLDAMEIGNTRVVGRAIGTDPITGDKVVYSQDDALVNVVTLRGFRIYTPLTRIQTGTQMPVYAVGLTDNETPFTFGNSVPPLTFLWSANSREVLQLHSVYHKSAIEPVPENNFAQRAVASETGLSTIRLKVKVNAGSHLQVYMDQVLQDEVQIQVFEKLSLINPSTCHGQILVTPNTDTSLKTNRDVAARVRYFILNNQADVGSESNHPGESPVVRLLDNGQLRSGPIPGTAVLHIVAQEEFGLNQTLVILVKVKPVSYLMINADSAVLSGSSSHLTTVPIGANLQFQVSYHDDVGDEFYATNIELGIRCARYDFLHVSNGVDNATLVVRAAEIGNTVLKVWDKKKPSMSDYINIPVGYAITPAQASVTLGSIICFSSPILTETGSRGSWKSKTKELDIEDQSGISTARAIGHGMLLYQFSTVTSTNTEVTVDPITEVSLGQGTSFLTNAGTGKVRSYPVSFNHDGNLIGENCSSVVAKTKFSPSFIPYICDLVLTQKPLDVSVSDLFTARATFDSEKGQHLCEISNVLPPARTSTSGPTDSLTQLAATLESNLRLTARVPASTVQGQQEVRSEPLDLEFLPAFYVHNPELHVSTSWPVGSVRVSAARSIIQDLEIKVSDTTVLESLGLEKDASNANIAVFPVRLLDSLTLWEKELVDISLEVSHARSGHRVRVPVYVKLIGQKPEGVYGRRTRQDLGWSHLLVATVSNYQSWLVICFIILITAAAVLIGYHAIVGPRYKTTSNPDVFLNQSGRSPTPSASFIQQSSPIASPSYTGRSSPTSPKLWSVSYNQQDSRHTPYKRSPFTYTPKS